MNRQTLPPKEQVTRTHGSVMKLMLLLLRATIQIVRMSVMRIMHISMMQRMPVATLIAQTRATPIPAAAAARMLVLGPLCIGRDVHSTLVDC